MELLKKICMVGWRNQNYTSEIYIMRLATFGASVISDAILWVVKLV